MRYQVVNQNANFAPLLSPFCNWQRCCLAVSYYLLLCRTACSASYTMFRRASTLVGRVAMRRVHTEAKLKQMGIELPTPKTPLGNFVMSVRTGNLLYTAGHLPISIDGELTTGKVGQEVSEDEAKEAARKVAVQLIATIKKDLGDLDRVKRIVKLVGFVNCTDGFTGQPKVVNGASDLFAEVFGERGVHSRSAVGTNALPMNVPVEIEAIVEFDDQA